MYFIFLKQILIDQSLMKSFLIFYKQLEFFKNFSKNEYSNLNYLVIFENLVFRYIFFSLTSIPLIVFKNNNYNSLLLTYQIGLHIKDLKILKFIQKNLESGHISISGDKCNFFINDQFSLINVVLPIFNSVKLNSSKYFQYKIFEKAVFLIKNKKHLTPEGKLKMIEYFNELKNFPLSFDASTLGNKNTIKITDS